MRKIIAFLVICTILICSAFSAFAWDAADMMKYNGKQIILPLQKPTIQIGSAFSLQSDMPNHAGTKGGVYKGKVDVTRPQAQTLMLEFNDYIFKAGQYHVSVWFMEDENNADKMTRMIRPMVGDSEAIIKEGNQYLFFSENQSTITLGRWNYASLDFTVSDSLNSDCIGRPKLKLKWECPTNYDSYASKNTAGDFYIYFSDFKLFKYPVTNLSFERTNSGEILEPQNAAFQTEFSVPVDPAAIESITINGEERAKDSLDLKTDENKLLISSPGGFPPGRTFNVSVQGITDIFGRNYDDRFDGTVTTKDNLSVEYNGTSDGNVILDITNNMNRDANFIIAVFYYTENSVKYVFYSERCSAVAPSANVTVNIPVSGDLSGLKAKAQIWDISNTSMIPVPLTSEIEL